MTQSRPKPAEPADLAALIALVEQQLRAGRLAEAAAAYGQILAMRPDMAEAHNNLGILLAQQGQSDQAAARFRQAIALKPDLPDAHNNLGSILNKQGQLDEAATSFARALALRPDYAEAHFNLGGVLWKQLKPSEAAACFEQALALRPNYAEAHNNLGLVLWHQNQFDQALARFEQALTLRPDYAEAHNNLGGVLWKQCQPAQAATRFAQALALRPDYAEAHNNLGKARLDLGRVDQALPHFQQALALEPDCLDAQLNLAACHLLEADFDRGWPAYEARLRTPGILPPISLPRWTGQPLAGRSLLLLAEQGFGDTFQFVGYAKLLKERGARIVLAAQAALGRLLASYSDVDELVALSTPQQWPRCDFYLPLLSTPLALKTVESTIPRDVPYLGADPKLAQRWRDELAQIDGFKIGIGWQCLRNFPADSERAIPLAQFALLASLPGVRLVSLQKGFGSEQIATVDFPVLDFSDRLDEAAGPFMDTAGLIGNLDLVVTSDTALAHLAGALGAPVWVALQFAPNWRWLRHRDDSPWYPTMRLFRQSAYGQWSDVFERIAQAVQTLRLNAESSSQ